MKEQKFYNIFFINYIEYLPSDVHIVQDVRIKWKQ